MILDGVVISEDNVFRLHSGGTSHVRFDVMRMLQHREDREYILKTLLRDVDYWDRPDYAPHVSMYTFAGIATGGAFLALILAEKLNAKFLIIGKDGSLSNPPDTQNHIYIVDDIETTGRSMEEARQALLNVGVDAGHISGLTLFHRPLPQQSPNGVTAQL